MDADTRDNRIDDSVDSSTPSGLKTTRRSLIGGVLTTGAGLAMGVKPEDARAGSRIATRAQAEAGVLTQALTFEPGTLDPAVGTDQAAKNLIKTLYEPLVDQFGSELEVQPALATGWEVSDDGTVYTFTIREGVTFHDGTPLDAEAVRFSLERIRTMNMGPAWMLRLVSAIEATDARTVTITLEEPFAPFINSLSFMFIVSPSFVNENSVDDDLGEAFLQNHAAGTGPYLLESWEPGQRIELVRNPDYWRGWDGNRNVERIDALVVNDNNTVRLMLENGDIDIAERVPIDFIDVYRSNPNLQVFVDTTLNLNWVMLNNQMDVTNDPRIRKAIAHAFDRESFINGILLGYGVESEGPFPPELVGEVPDLPQYTFDLDAARQLLAEAGYPDGGFALDAYFITGQVEQQRLLELLQANLAQLNINMTISNLTWPVLLGALQELETAKQAYAWALWPNYPDPDAYLSMTFHSESQGSTGRNLMYYSNPEVDELIIEARMAQDPETRAELYRTAAVMIWEDCPGVLSHRLMYPIAMNKRVEGYVFNAMWVGFVRYYDLHLA